MKKISVSILLILIILTVLATSVFAADLSITYTLDKPTVTEKLGATVQVVLGVNDIDATTEGINAIEGKITYDEQLIESVDVVSAGNNWSVSYNKRENDEKKGKVVISNMNAVKEAQPIAKLMITLKTDATVKTGKVTLSDLTTSYGSTATSPVTKTITINVEENSTPHEEGDPDVKPDTEPSTPETPSSTPADSETQTPKSSTPTQTTSKSTGTTKNTSNAISLPKAGIETGILLVILAGVIVAIIELIKYKKIEK